MKLTMRISLCYKTLMLVSRYIFVGLLTFALAFLPIFCPCSGTATASSPTATASYLGRADFNNSGYVCRQFPGKSDLCRCHELLSRDIPAARASLPLIHAKLREAALCDLLSHKMYQPHTVPSSFFNIHALDLSQHTLLHQHCALMV